MNEIVLAHDDHWFYQLPANTHTQTPVTARQLQQLCAAGSLPKDRHVWRPNLTATNEWVESTFGKRCGALVAGGLPRFGEGHENPEACKVTCNSVLACIGFTWHKAAVQYHGQVWDGGCEYVCNQDTGVGICKGGSRSTGYGKMAIVSASNKCPDSNQAASTTMKCYSKPCARDTVAAKDCSWYCLAIAY